MSNIHAVALVYPVGAAFLLAALNSSEYSRLKTEIKEDV